MANAAETFQDTHEIKSTDCEDVEKVLMGVVKRRKTIPAKCMDINKEISKYELLRLSWPIHRALLEPFYWREIKADENAKIVTEDYEEKEKFKKIIQEFKSLKSFHFTLDDVNEAEQKLEKYHERIQEINRYLEKRKKGFK